MIVSIMQPAYLPWSGYFHRLAVSDLHISLDHVAIDRNSRTKFANRNRVRTPKDFCWLTVPLRSGGCDPERLRLDRLEIANDTSWAADHWKTIRYQYGRAPHFDRYAPFLSSLYERRWDALLPLLRESTDHLLEALGVRTPFRYSSEMGVGGTKDELLVELCRAAGARTYLSGPLGRDYIRESLFEAAGIRVVYHSYRHPTYPQMFPGFVPNLSVLDLLMNCGPESLGILSMHQEPICP